MAVLPRGLLKIALLVAVASGAAVGPGTELVAPPPVSELAIPLESPSGPAALAPAYHLPVVEVPPPPADRLGAVASLPGASDGSQPHNRSRCPMDVRAIVTGGESPFAVLAIGDDSHLVRAGDGLKTPTGWVAVSSIAPRFVTIRHRGAVRRCVLSDSDSDSDSGSR